MIALPELPLSIGYCDIFFARRLSGFLSVLTKLTKLKEFNNATS